MSNALPLGKTSMSHRDFAAGVSTTQANRARGGGASHANPSSRRSTTSGGWTPGDGMQSAGHLQNAGSRKK